MFENYEKQDEKQSRNTLSIAHFGGNEAITFLQTALRRGK